MPPPEDMPSSASLHSTVAAPGAECLGGQHGQSSGIEGLGAASGHLESGGEEARSQRGISPSAGKENETLCRAVMSPTAEPFVSRFQEKDADTNEDEELAKMLRSRSFHSTRSNDTALIGVILMLR